MYYLVYNLGMVQTIPLPDVCRRLGLPKGSAEVLRVLEHGQAMGMSSIVRAAHIHRPAAYRAVRALCAQGVLESRQRGKRAVYHSRGQKVLAALFAKAVHAVTKSAPPPPSTDTSFSSVRYLSGVSGITEVFADVLQHTKKGDTFYRYTSERNLDEVNSYLPKEYRAIRDRKKLERQVISNFLSGRQKRPRLERFVKFLEKGQEHFMQNTIQLIYGSRIAFIDISKKECVIIENESLAEFQKVIFKALYRRL